MGRHVIIGAGPIGSGTARRLADDGHEVRLVTRRGRRIDRRASRPPRPTPPTPTAMRDLTVDADADLQLRQPSLRLMGHRLAPDRRARSSLRRRPTTPSS